MTKTVMSEKEIRTLADTLEMLDEAREKTQAIEAAFLVILSAEANGSRMFVEEIKALLAAMWSMCEEATEIITDVEKNSSELLGV